MLKDTTQPEEFRATWRQTWHGNLRPFLTVNIMVLVFSWVVGYLIWGIAGSVLLPLVLIGGLVAVHRYASWSQGLRLSPQGVEFLRRDGGVTRMRWADIEQVAVLTQKGRGVVAPYGVARAAASTGADNYIDANTGPGLVGRGESLNTTQARSQLGSAWVAQSLTPAALRLNVIDRDWPRGRIGAWVRRYRPDLLPPVSSPAPRG